ncbi:MAG: ASKHA domain-containing protein [Chloroflexi bacterium]|nr:ASKHA domain-containing protein [Chloroflexota bacterium]
MADKPTVILQPSGRRGEAMDWKNLRSIARELGVDIESICAENATCGKCKIVVEEGTFERYGITSKRENLSPVTPEEAEFFRRRPKMMASHNWEVGQVRLACQARVRGDVLISVPEESQVNKQVVRKTATQRAFEIKPSIRKYLVELMPPTISNPRADWERLQNGIATSMGLVRSGETNLPKAKDLTIDYECLRTLSATLRESKWRVTVSVWQDKDVVRVEPGYVEGLYGAAVDIGSTTIALYLCDLESGEILAAESEMNPQIVYGEDVMSRIQYTIVNEDGLQKLHDAVIGALNKLLQQAAKSANISTDDILEMVIAGNTTMHHLFLNLPTKQLGLAPYVPAINHSVDIKARELGLQINRSANVHVLPTIASFIGADTTGVLIAEEPHKQDENWLIIDIGTNAELVLGNKTKLMCTSTPTGPALEGAHVEYGMRAAPGAIERVEIDEKNLEPRYKIIGEENWNIGKAKGICGSAIIDAVAELFRVGIVDARGRFVSESSSNRIRNGEAGMEYVIAWADETTIQREIPITQQDVRQIQLAKGALFVAARTLLNQFNIQTPDKILLAGGFGTYLDKTKAMLIGMIPDCPLENVYVVGNSAGDGARIALLNWERREEAAKVAARVNRYELPADPDFQRQFMLAMNFPHMSEPFPHIAHLIPNRKVDPLAEKFSGGTK